MTDIAGIGPEVPITEPFAEEMYRVFQAIFVKYIDQTRIDRDILDTLFDRVPKSVVDIINSDQLVGIKRLAEWFQTNMKFDKTLMLPRRNDLLKIFESGRGRCGEYANLFNAFCRACGIQSRIVYDMSDHLWVEVYDNRQWIQFDPTLSEVMPTTKYQRALSGKELSWVLAFEPGHITDVTFDYVPDEQKAAVTERRKALQPLIEMLIETFNLGAEREDWQ